MTLHNNLLDRTSWKLLEGLQIDGRASYRTLGNQVQLSTPSVSERIRKLEEEGVISGYRAVLDLEKLGRAITAFVSVQSTPQTNPSLIAFIQASPVVLEGHYITGEASFILKIAVASIGELEQFIKKVSHYGRTVTSIVMSTHVQNKIIINEAFAD
ncbi:MAG: Lrp/AsnC family transcriptional regulator [Ardenticatenaceae bacterium]